MLPSCVFLDLETTGATPLKDRITEIALIHFENGVEVSRWQTLVNPEVSIPPFIQQLTGITDQMVVDAPTFKEVATELLDHLSGRVLCAHNVRFDHGFLKNEFKRIGVNLRQKVLCTVKLSRKLYPQHRSHGLDAIIQRHDLTCIARHRAMGDVEVMVAYFEAVKRELGASTLESAAAELLKGAVIPSGLDPDILDELPETPGVYLFFGEQQMPLYIGKSVNIRTRVMSHFSGDHGSTKEMRIGQEIKHVEWITTAGEFSALLLESRLVKARQPVYNRHLRRERQLCSWRIADSAEAKPLLTLIRDDEIDPAHLGQLFGTFRSKKQAVEVLRNLAEIHQLCPQALGLESGTGACFASQIKRCKGVCAGKESPAIHYLRLQQAMMAHRLKSWPYPGKIGIREFHEENEKTEIHIFDQWCHIATIDEAADLDTALASNPSTLAFDLDTYKILLKEINKPDVELIQF